LGTVHHKAWVCATLHSQNDCISAVLGVEEFWAISNGHTLPLLKGQVCFSGCLHSSEGWERKSGRGWLDEWAEDPAQLESWSVLELVIHLIAKSHAGMCEPLL